jgi:hypothetical protein
MPNLVENSLVITGPPEEVTDFLAYARGVDDNGDELLLDFDRFIPQPERITRDMITDPMELTDLRAMGGDGSLVLCWRSQYWGTKWHRDIILEGQQTVDENDLEVAFTFDSAWSPPLPVIRAMSEKFPSLLFDLDYYECLSGFSGQFCYHRGRVVSRGIGDYSGKRGG